MFADVAVLMASLVPAVFMMGLLSAFANRWQRAFLFANGKQRMSSPPNTSPSIRCSVLMTIWDFPSPCSSLTISP
uniref:Putative secreted peptide n=1 Tax=Anopheles braziliensis TaxID=58242 RepID=A0A2M3ZQG5_9DIPT